jgi:hypothetical protein
VPAKQSAKRAVRAQIRANGQKIAQFSAKEITLLAEAHLAQHRERLRTEAEHAIATWPGFAYLRVPGANLTINAQTEKLPISTTSTLQISGAK